MAIDQGVTASDGSWNIFTASGGSFAKVGQTFKPSSSVSNIASFSLELSKVTSTNQTVQLSLYNTPGEANAGTAAIASISQTITSTSPATYIFKFASVISLVPDQSYFFTLANLNVEGAYVSYQDSDIYTRGDMYINSYGSGSPTNYTKSLYDLKFTTYYQPTYVITAHAVGGGGCSLVTETASITISSSPLGGGSLTIYTNYQSIQQKDYEYRVSDHSGNFIGIWQDVKSDFSYQQSINQAPSEIVVQIARAPDNLITTYDALLDKAGATVTDQNGNPIYAPTKNPNAVGVGTDVEYNYNVDVYTFYGGYDQLLDKNSNPILDSTGDTILVQYGAPNGKRVYSGYIVDYELDYGQQEGVTVTIVPNATELNHYLYLSSSNTTVVQNSTDPVAMAKAAMDSYITQGGVLGYTTSTMVLSGWISSYTFKLQRIKDVLDKVIELLPAGYYYYVDPSDNFVYLKLKGTTADHTFYYEQHITDMKLKRSISQLVNKVYFVGGDMGAGVDLLRYNSDATSISTIRPGLDILSDSRVTLTSSADVISQSKINDYKVPRYRTTITISDAVYDIETIKLGQMVAFENFGNFVDALILQVVTLTRAKHTVTLDLDMVVPNDTKRLEEIKRNLLSEQVDAIPVAPI